MKYRVAAVSYINTLPLLHGLQTPDLRNHTDIVLAHPARCAELLQNGEVDIALCPVGALPAIGDYHIITDFCIGCDGPVRTVCVYSHVPLDQVSQIVLSSESRTSNQMVQILNREYWHFKLRFLSASSTSSVAHHSFSGGGVGFLHIGDICFEKEKEYAYRTDLGQSWKEWTGLPFVFACWVSRKKIDDVVVEAMNNAFGLGVRSIDQLAFPPGMDAMVLREYLKKNISYALDSGKQLALRKFLGLETELALSFQ
jgi:chorismate dehydratase